MVFLGIRVAVGSPQKISPVVSARSTPVSVCLRPSVPLRRCVTADQSRPLRSIRRRQVRLAGGEGKGVDGNDGARLGLR